MSGANENSTLELEPLAEQGQYYDLIKQAIPDCLANAAPDRRTALKQTKPRFPDWYAHTTTEQRARIKALMEAVCESQHPLDKTLSSLQSAEAFGQTLLEAELKKIGLVLPVNDVSLRLYVPVESTFSGVTGHKVQTFTLLQAALHNFEEPETQPGYFPSPSGFITPPDDLGRYESYQTPLTVERFITLCRTLDIGGQYQRHVESFLRPTGVVTAQSVRREYMAHKKDALRADAYLAQLKGDISQSNFTLIERIIEGEKNITLERDQQVWYRTPCVMNIKLHGCLVIDLSVKYRYSNALIVWMPGDPEHPLKYYATFDEYRDELLRKLTAKSSSGDVNGLTPYQHFLTRFIERKDLPYYYSRLTRTVTREPEQPWGSQWRRAEQGKYLLELREPLLPAHNLREFDTHPSRIQTGHPSININIDAIHGLWAEVDVWGELFEIMRKKTLSDAEISAVPTADADANYRAKRLSHYLTIGMVGLNLASLIVPGLGEVMLVVMAGQLMYEVLDGFIEWSEGDTDAAWGHLTDVLENVALLAIGAAAVHVAVAPVIEKLKQVTLPNGDVRLWKPDLKAYEQPTDLPAGVRANKVGLYELDERQILHHEGKHYSLKKDLLSNRYRAQHPTQSGAYQPEFSYNGDGIWVHEGEQPLTWDGDMLRRRLVPAEDGLSDNDIKQILSVSDVSENQLRRMYVEHQPMPVLLREAIRQFKTQARVKTLIAEIRNGVLTKQAADQAAFFTIELTRWPSNKLISIVDTQHPLEPPRIYSPSHARDASEISISLAELMDGKLPARVVDALSEHQLSDLLGESVPWPRDARIEEFKQLLARHMEKNSKRLFDGLSADVLAENDMDLESIKLIQRVFSRLSTDSVRELLASARPSEHALLAKGKIPLRLGRAARESQRHTRLAQAYSGLYLEDLVNVDTEALVLNSVENIPGWQDDLRLEIRENSYQGALRASYGPEGATYRKVLVRTQEGKYETYDEHENVLHGKDDLYRSVQQALTDQHRASLGLPHTWQGNELKLKVQSNALPRSTLRKKLKMLPEYAPAYKGPLRQPANKLGYPLSGRGAVQAARANKLKGFEDRYEMLYPLHRGEEGILSFQQFLALDESTVELRLSQLEKERRTLSLILNDWIRSPINGEALTGNLKSNHAPILKARHVVKEKLLDAWDRVGYQERSSNEMILGEAIVFDGDDLHGVLETLPKLNANFDHVTVIGLSGSQVTDGINDFLSSFRRLGRLELSDNNLTQVPAAIDNMLSLRELELANNNIVLTQESVVQLAQLRMLNLLDLSTNPLGRLPDIAQMPVLDTLFLSECGIDSWPVGLLALPRPDNFLLDLSDNAITQIPDVAPGSDRAGTLARSVVSDERVSPHVLERLEVYRESLGHDTHRHSLSIDLEEREPWLSHFSPEQRLLKQALWDSVEAEVGSVPFFDVIADLTEKWELRSAEFIADIQEKVWRMLRAIEESPVLRDKLFDMALAPTTCVDSGVQLFNAMGMEVLLYEVSTISEPLLLRLEVFDLAKGRVRLDELGRIARARVNELLAQGRKFPAYDAEGMLIEQLDEHGMPVKSIDEVEIYLAYTSRLAKRLDLPWQSEMFFIEDDVTAEMLESAYQRVLALEAGDGLRNQLSEIHLWQEYLERTYHSEFEALKEKNFALIEYQEAQKELANNGYLSDQKKQALRSEIDAAGATFGLPSNEIIYGQPMTDEAYSAAFVRLGDEKTALYKTLTIF